MTNALSERLEVEIKRDGGVHRDRVRERRGRRRSCKKTGSVGAQEHRHVAAHLAQQEVFRLARRSSLADLERIVRSKAVLLPGVKVTLNIETAKETDEADLELSGRDEGLPRRS